MSDNNRVLEKGTIYLNRFAGWRTLFVYEKTSGTLAKGYNITLVYGKNKIEEAIYYKSALNDTIKFPAVGKINLQEVMIQAILNSIDKKELLTNEYEKNGHRITRQPK